MPGSQCAGVLCSLQLVQEVAGQRAPTATSSRSACFVGHSPTTAHLLPTKLCQFWLITRALYSSLDIPL